jgi:hypothetical protein
MGALETGFVEVVFTKRSLTTRLLKRDLVRWTQAPAGHDRPQPDQILPQAVLLAVRPHRAVMRSDQCLSVVGLVIGHDAMIWPS